MLKWILFLGGMLLSLVGEAQSVKVMSYNVLTFPEEGGIDRTDTLGKIIDYYQPDLLILQELKSAEGLADITAELNEHLGNYASGTYVPQISNPANDWRLQQNLVYNTDLFDLIDEQTITTNYRDVNYFKLALKNDAEALLHVYVSHLKSSFGDQNAQIRFEMAEFWYDHIRDLPPNSNVIAAGDFNVYSGTEPAYEMLLSNNGSNTLKDPIDMPNWDEFGFSNFEILTQSTRASSPGNGAGGGMDDRFDFILLSDQIMNGTNRFAYMDDTYKALGNNGTCYNQDLLDCQFFNEVPFDILRALRNMSDHLPIVLTMEVSTTTSTENESVLSENISLFPNPARGIVTFQSDHQQSGVLKLFDLTGKCILQKEIEQQSETISIDQLTPGIYFVNFVNQNGTRSFHSKLTIH